MATYTYRPQAAVGENGQLTNVGSGQLFGITDTAFATPLVARDVAGANKTVIALSGIGQTETFLIDDHPELWWKSGTVVVHLFSITGIIATGEAAAASAASSAASSNSSRAAAEAAQSAVTTLMANAVLKVNGVSPDEDGNVNVAGGGGSGITAVMGQGPDGTGNVATLTAALLGAATSGHTHSFASKNGLTGVTGTPTASTFLRGDGTWAAPAAGGGGSGTVTSVNGSMPDGSGAVTLTPGNLGLGAIDNTSDANKPLSQAMVDALVLKANDNIVVKTSGAQTVAGVKTFSSSPVVPINSFAIDKITGLTAALAGKTSGLNGITGVWGGSLTAYNALAVKDPNVLYVTTGA